MCSARVQCVNVVGILVELRLRERQRLVGQLHHAVADGGIERLGQLLGQEVVAGIGLGIQRSNAIQLLEDDRRQQCD